MVKIPSLDDLKKAGASLMDSAKSGKLVDGIKTHIENVGERITREGAEMPKSEAPVKEQFQILSATIKEIYHVQSQQTQLMKKLEAQLAVLSRVVATETPATAATESVVTSVSEQTVTKTEEKKEP